MPRVDEKCLNALLCCMFDNAGIETSFSDGISSDYAVHALEEPDEHRRKVLGDTSIETGEAFELAVKLCTIAFENPLSPDYERAKAAIAEAQENLRNMRADRLDERPAA